jgi:iron-only hydrogenase group A
MKITIDENIIEAQDGMTIVEAAQSVGIRIPTLCWLKGISCPTACRVCMVEIVGMPRLVTACNTPVRDGMVVKTASSRVIAARKANIELQLSDHSKSCLSCPKSLKCELQKLAQEYDCDAYAIGGAESSKEIDQSHPCIVKDLAKCIQCGRCIAVCKRVQGVSAITKIRRGFNAKVGCAHDLKLVDSPCVGCGQCTLVCPTGALMEKNDVKRVLEFLGDPNLTVIAQVAPAVRVALAEEFGAEMGHFCESKIATALKMVGFNQVFDVNTGADFTVIEEGGELLERIKAGKGLPMFSSCCPAWFNFVEKFYPEFMPNVSTCKSPTQMLGALIKSYYATHRGLDAKTVRVVDIMPCTAKKGERLRGEDVDVCLTTREVAGLFRKKGIQFDKIPDGKFDSPLGEYSGAALIFGVSGGVTEAVLRTAVKKITGKEAPDFEFNIVRGSEGIKEAAVTVGKQTLKIAIVNGLANARRVLDDIKSGKSDYTFVEVMACPGGCVNGGGQPYCDKNFVSVRDIVTARGGCLYKKDKELAKTPTRRISHENESMKNIYKEYLDKTKGLNHKLFHRHK